MDEAEAIEFLTALRAEKIRVKPGWVTAACPLAKWLHTHHADSNPSFALSILPGGRSHYTCFACQSGSAEELLGTLMLYVGGQTQGYDFARCHQLLSGEEYLTPLPEYGTQKTGAAQFSEWPAYWLESFKAAQWVADPAVYLAARAVPVHLVTQYDLRYDPKRQMIVCPYWDVYGRLAGARGRSILPEGAGATKHFDYSWQGKNNAKLVWYGEPALNLPGPVVVVEGQFDLFRVVQAYPKVVAALTAKPTWEKVVKLGDSRRVIQIPDRDETGEASIAVYAKYCAKMGLDHQVLRLDAGAKDPADCAVAYLRDRLEEVL